MGLVLGFAVQTRQDVGAIAGIRCLFSIEMSVRAPHATRATNRRRARSRTLGACNLVYLVYREDACICGDVSYRVRVKEPTWILVAGRRNVNNARRPNLRCLLRCVIRQTELSLTLNLNLPISRAGARFHGGDRILGHAVCQRPHELHRRRPASPTSGAVCHAPVQCPRGRVRVRRGGSRGAAAAGSRWAGGRGSRMVEFELGVRVCVARGSGQRVAEGR